jgi:HAD superfamily hydrolase (TIGR01509 family)
VPGVAGRPPPRRAGLLFDLDGTLAQTEHLHLAAFNVILAPSGRVLDEAAFVRHVSGQVNEAITAHFFPAASLAERQRLADDKEAAFRSLAASSGVAATPGAAEMLAWARAHHVATGLVTNAPIANAVLMVEVLGLADAFDLVLSADETPRGKPHPDPYLAAVDRLGLAPERTVVVEDSLTGVAAGRAAGLAVVALATDFTAARLHDSGADRVCTDLADPALYAWLAQRLGVPDDGGPRHQQV